ncbi:hypothetical protein EI94DRAFT_866251 [Lactarius quietus]|nr:hypothetical protein EI94DRAFT_866251 [Lactarius quietus]
MRLLSLLPLFLVAPCFAMPSKRQSLGVPASAMTIIPPGLGPQPTTSIKFVALVVGVASSTCNSTTGTFASDGILAQVFDMTSLFPLPEFFNIPQDAFTLWNASPSNDALDPGIFQQIQSKFSLQGLGQLSFTGSGTLSPFLNFTSATNDPTSTFTGKIVADAPSINSTTNDADWQVWNSTAGALAKQVYFIDTVGGLLDLNSSCNPSNPGLTSKITAALWGFA